MPALYDYYESLMLLAAGLPRTFKTILIVLYPTVPTVGDKNKKTTLNTRFLARDKTLEVARMIREMLKSCVFHGTFGTALVLYTCFGD